jgi:MraZ protein
VSIPAKLRKHISPEANDTMVMTQGTSKCIDVYPYDQWQIVENNLLQLNSFNPEHSKFIRMISQYATEDILDSQSRILLPQFLIDYAGIEKEVLVLGVLKKIELWNPDTYKAYIEASGETYEEIAAKVMANGK